MTLIFLLECLGGYAFELEASCAKIDQQSQSSSLHCVRPDVPSPSTDWLMIAVHHHSPGSWTISWTPLRKRTDSHPHLLLITVHHLNHLNHSPDCDLWDSGMALIFLLERFVGYAFELEASCAKIDQQANLRLSTLYYVRPDIPPPGRHCGRARICF